MKKVLFLLVIVVVSGFTTPLPAEQLTAEQVINKAWSKFRQITDEKEIIKITIVNDDGRQERKEIIRWSKYDSRGEDKIALKFIQPASDKNLGLLIWRHASSADELWLKLPSLGSVRKISPGDQKYFGGTDFTYEDMRQLSGERIKDFTYSFLNSSPKEWSITAVPKGGVESGYAKRIINVTSNFIVTSISYYDLNGKLVKSQTHENIVQPNGAWRTNSISVRNEHLKRRTLLELESREVNKGIGQDKFQKEFLLSERYK